MLKFLATLPLLLSACICPPFCFTTEPVDSVSNWSDIEVVFARVEGEVGPQQEIQMARTELSDVDGDGEFPLRALGFLIEQRIWSDPYLDPLNLYIVSVETDPSLEPAGIQVRMMAAARLRVSLEEILSP